LWSGHRYGVGLIVMEGRAGASKVTAEVLHTTEYTGTIWGPRGGMREGGRGYVSTTPVETCDYLSPTRYCYRIKVHSSYL
jgi:hypothetical protein